ncbi:hypothetical protein F2P81_013380 [Scophthalmus maximus]|uniref:AT-rich interactive domain-containing protein 3 n=1 Tax=Scophthalmus maximus TaxID=52904 RepID=A0A6A4SQL3_SCOMX|nr:hypothetical protein F2P81_013380 [Scophthalmus maximus]
MRLMQIFTKASQWLLPCIRSIKCQIDKGRVASQRVSSKSEQEKICLLQSESQFLCRDDSRLIVTENTLVGFDFDSRAETADLYELDDDEKRKEFLDDLFSFMQKRGTPVNRIPIMAKQVLDLYMLYKLVTEKGGLVEVINKKIWREITKGLNLPTSITSAAFTLRTQYMKYLYPYECEKRGLSSPGELQAAIDSNRREGRRQSYGSAIFNYSPAGTPALLSSPKMQMSHLPTLTHNNGHLSQVHGIKKEEPMMAGCLPSRLALPMSPSSHHAAAVAAQAAALEQLREKLEGGEPPEKRMMMVAEEQQRIMQHALQQNLLAMATQLPLNIKLNNRDDRQETALNLSTNGISSINMSIEINGVVYTGQTGLCGRPPPLPHAHCSLFTVFIALTMMTVCNAPGRSLVTKMIINCVTVDGDVEICANTIVRQTTIVSRLLGRQLSC